MRLKIIDELRDLIPPLSEEEKITLEENLKKEGCREAVIVWNDIIIDGHNRYELCTKNDIPFDIREMKFDDIEQAKAWMIKNQLGRRNLPKYAAVILAEKEMRLRETKKKKPSREDVAEAANVGESTVRRVRKIEERLAEAEESGKTIQGATPKEIRNDLLSGERSIYDVYQAVQKPHVSNNSGNNEWYTPKEYIEAAREVMGSIDLDPASSDIANKTVQAATYYTAETNGLDKEWKGNVWLNPPYSADLIGKFIDKVMESDVEQMVILVNNATDTNWFLKLTEKAEAIVFTKGRVKFYQPDNSSGTPLQGQALLYIGKNKEKFLREFRKFGWGVEIKH